MPAEEVFRLAKPKKKGLLPLLFSRFLLIFLLLLLQVVLIGGFYIWLRDFIPHYAVFWALFTIGMVFYLFNHPMDSTAKLTWMFIIAVLPLAGASLFCFTQTNAGHRKLQKRVAACIQESKNAIAQPEVPLAALQDDSSGTTALAAYLNRSGCFPVYNQTEVKYFPSGEEKFAAMLEELSKAERCIYMEYFIIEEGYMWGEILRILVEKARQGVDVRVMYDGMCEISQLPANYCSLLRANGIKAKAFSPIIPVVSSHYNYRDHRKILVIDGKTAFNGGVNLADEYINRKERFGYWKDTAIMLKGDAVKSFTLMFLQMWNIDEKNPVYLTDADCRTELPAVPSGFVMPYGDCPLDEDKVGEAVYMDILNRAKTYVHIMTPYLILDGELETALKFAAQRGVDVKLILPGIPDKKAAYALAKSHYNTLVKAGVQIYEFTPGFVHAKVCVSDDVKAVVGTINLDYRSLYHHFECATYLYQADCIADIEKDFQDTLSKCRTVTKETIKNEKLSYKLEGRIIKILAPLM